MQQHEAGTRRAKYLFILEDAGEGLVNVEHDGKKEMTFWNVFYPIRRKAGVGVVEVELGDDCRGRYQGWQGRNKGNKGADDGLDDGQTGKRNL